MRLARIGIDGIGKWGEPMKLERIKKKNRKGFPSIPVYTFLRLHYIIISVSSICILLLLYIYM